MSEEIVWIYKTYTCPKCNGEISRVHLSDEILCNHCGYWFENTEYNKLKASIR